MAGTRKAGRARDGRREARRLGERGNALRRAGDLRQAADVLAEALRLAPDDVDLRNDLGNVLLALRRPDEAVAAFEAALRIAPDDARLHVNLGSALRKARRVPAAIAAYGEALRLAPELAEAHQNLGNALVEQGDLERAVACLRRACELAPRSATAAYNLGCALLERRELAGARAAFERALALGGVEAAARVNLGRLDEIEGRRADALAQWRGAAAAAPALARPRYLLARAGSCEHAAELAALVERADGAPDDRIEAHFGLAYWHEQAGRADPAFEHFAAGNRLKRARVRAFDPAAHAAALERLARVFDADLFRRAPGAHPSEVPLLVVGMPRSGTTLVEALLARHPAVAARGELRALGELARAFGARAPGWPEVAPALAPDERRAAAQRYLDLLAPAPGEARAVDKLPANFLNLGLVALLFANARVVHCRRDPLDTCVSIWRQLFEKDHVAYGYDLDHLAAYQRGYARLMEHWRAVLPLPMLEIDYEELVTDVEGSARRLVEFAGLGWDERCLAPEAAEHPVYTASAWRVRAAVDTSSVGRAAFFGERLAGLRRALAG